MSEKPDFAAARLSVEEWPLVRTAYPETYPVRPLLNHVDELAAALRTSPCPHPVQKTTDGYWYVTSEDCNKSGNCGCDQGAALAKVTP